MKEEKKFIESFFGEMKNRNIRYCILRNAEEVKNGYAHDIDMSYDVLKADEIKQILDSVAKEMNWHLHLSIGNMRDENNIKCFHYHKECEGKKMKIVHFDFFPNFEWNGYILLNNEQLLNGITTDTIYHRASNCVEAVTKLFIRLLYNGEIKEKYKEFIYDTIICNPQEVIGVLRCFLEEEKCKKVVTCVSEKKWCTIEEERLEYINSISKKNKRMKIKKIIYLLNKFQKRPGIIIAFEGFEKNDMHTIVDGLYDVLDNTFPDGMRHCYSCYRETSVRNWIKLRILLGKGHLVVFERYYYHYYIERIRYALRFRDYFALVWRRFLLSPDIIFVSDENALLECNKKMLAETTDYQPGSLAQLIPKTKKINANQSLSNIIFDVSREILEYGYGRYK